MGGLAAVPSAAIEELTFFDREGEVYGVVGPRIAMLFKDGGLLAYSDSNSAIEQRTDGTHFASMTALRGSFELTWSPLSTLAGDAGAEHQVCAVTGTVTVSGETPVKLSSLGSASLRRGKRGSNAPRLRSLAAVFDERNALVLQAFKPAVFHGHGDERIAATLLENATETTPADVRLSTVYDERGMHMQASVELWLPDDQLPRRLAGTAIAGTHAELSDENVNLAFFEWQMGSRSAVGLYEVAMSVPPPIAA